MKGEAQNLPSLVLSLNLVTGALSATLPRLPNLKYLDLIGG